MSALRPAAKGQRDGQPGVVDVGDGDVGAGLCQLQRQVAAGSRPGIIPRLGIQSPQRSTIAGMMPT